MCMHDTEHDLKNSVFKVIAYIKYEFRFFWSSNFLLVSRLLVGGRVVGGWWSVCWLVGGQWSVVG